MTFSDEVTWNNSGSQTTITRGAVQSAIQTTIQTTVELIFIDFLSPIHDFYSTIFLHEGFSGRIIGSRLSESC